MSTTFLEHYVVDSSEVSRRTCLLKHSGRLIGETEVGPRKSRITLWRNEPDGTQETEQYLGHFSLPPRPSRWLFFKGWLGNLFFISPLPFPSDSSHLQSHQTIWYWDRREKEETRTSVPHTYLQVYRRTKWKEEVVPNRNRGPSRPYTLVLRPDRVPTSRPRSRLVKNDEMDGLDRSRKVEGSE